MIAYQISLKLHSITSYYPPHPLILNHAFYLTCLSWFYHFSAVHFVGKTEQI